MDFLDKIITNIFIQEQELSEYTFDDMLNYMKANGIEYEFEEDYMTVFVKDEQELNKLVDYLDDDNISYDVLEHSEDEETNEVMGYTIIIYLDNFDIEELLDEVKRVIKVNARGEKRIKLKCKKGFKFKDGKCIVISGTEKINKRKAIRKAVRTKKNKGAGYLRRINKKRNKALKKRKILVGKKMKNFYKEAKKNQY